MTFLALGLAALAPRAQAQDKSPGYDIVPPAGAFMSSGGRVINIKTDLAPLGLHNAVGDGVTDDSQAFIDAMTYCASNWLYWLTTGGDTYVYGTGVHFDFTIYIPNGTYKVTKPLVYSQPRLSLPNSLGDDLGYLRVMGESRENTIIKLADNSPGYNNNGTLNGYGVKQPVLAFLKPQEAGNPYSGSNVSFDNACRNLTVDIGSGNPGAIGVIFESANSGLIENIRIKSSDPAYTGYVGLYMPTWSLQAYMHDIIVTGFDYGMYFGSPAESNPALEYITLSNQRVAGIWCVSGGPVFRRVSSSNSVPGLIITGTAGSAVVLDSQFTGGSSSASAITVQETSANSGAFLFARDVNTAGYQNAILRGSTVDAPVGWIQEYTTFGYQHKFSNTLQSLNVPIQEDPIVQYSTNASDWVCVEDQAGVTMGAKLQAALNSGKSMVWFRTSGTNLNGMGITVNVPASVKCVMGFGTVLPYQTRFYVNAADASPILFDDIGGQSAVKSGAQRPVVIHGGSLYYWRDTTTAGIQTAFIDGVSGTGQDVSFCPANTMVYCRAVNTEGNGNFKVYGGTCVDMGFKTEATDISWSVQNGGILEVLGGYRNEVNTDNGKAEFENIGSQASFVGWGSGSKVYTVAVSETRAGVTNILLGSALPVRQDGSLSHWWVPCYVGYTMQPYPITNMFGNIPVTGVTVSPASATIGVAGTQQLTATVAPADASNKSVTWTTSDATKATVNTTGLVTGTTAGSATITATTVDGGKTNTSAITVTNASPPTPTGLTATAGNAQVSLSWTASFGATSYNVYRSTTSGGPYTTIATNITTTGYTDTGLANGTTYYYVVTAVNGFGEGGYSNQANATPPTSFVKASQNQLSGTSIRVTMTNNASDTIVVACREGTSGTGISPSSVTDTAGNSYTLIRTSSQGTARESGVFVATNVVASTNTITFTWGVSATLAIVALEFANAASVEASVTNSTGNTAVTTISSGSITTTNNGDLLILAADAASDETTWTAGSGYTIPVNGATPREAVEYFIAGAAGAYSTSISDNVSASLDSIYLALSPAKVVLPPSPFSFTHPGNQLSLTWSNGSGILLSSTNVALPMTNWVPVVTNPTMPYNIIISNGVPQMFFRAW